MPRPFTEDERQVLREKLIDAARESIEQVGIRRTSLDDLVRRVGISKGGFYLLFDSKEDLLVTVFDRAEEEVRAHLDSLIEDAPAEERTERLVRFLFDLVEHHPLIAILADPSDGPVLWRAVPSEEMARRFSDDDRYFAGVADRLREVDALDPRIATSAFVALPRLALAIAQSRSLVGEGYPALVDIMVEALAARLRPEGAS